MILFHISNSFFIPVCPPGFNWLDQKGCVSVATEPLSKSEALKKCRQQNPNANLMMPQTENEQKTFQNFISGLNLTGNNYFLGVTKTNGHWYWDDESAVFVMRKCFPPLNTVKIKDNIQKIIMAIQIDSQAKL